MRLPYDAHLWLGPSPHSQALVQVAASVLALMLTTWIFSRLVRRASIVDVVWGGGIATVAALYLHLLSLADIQAGTPAGVRACVVGALPLIAGVRLMVFLGRRHLKAGHGEDWRYQEMEAHNGPLWPWISLVKVFLLQGTVMIGATAPFRFSLAPVTVSHPVVGPLAWTDVAGVVVWVLGFFTEVISDRQLYQWKKNPQGAFCRAGFWAWSRHPNYFGECMQWWSYWLCTLGAGAPVTAILSPIFMSLLLRYVSGVAMMDRRMVGRPGWDAYAASVPAFIPWFSAASPSTTASKKSK